MLISHTVNKSFSFIAWINITFFSGINFCHCFFHCFRYRNKTITLYLITYTNFFSFWRNHTMNTISESKRTITIINRIHFSVTSLICKRINTCPFLTINKNMNTAFFNCFKIIYKFHSIFTCHWIRICITHITLLVSFASTITSCFIPIIF